MKHIFGFILSLLFANATANAQLVTNSNTSPTFLVQNILLGGGVTATNITYTGDVNAIGSFNGTNTNIGLNSGILLTTGTVNNVTNLFGNQQGPFGPNDNDNAGIDNGAPGDALLDGLAGTNTFNAAVLEFDFVAVGTNVSFRYVFASEEYPDFAPPNPSDYNDVFAFFITGPNPAGGSYSNSNIAIIPGTTSAVSIFNINPVTNSSLFNNNGDGTGGPQYTDNTVVQYNGFTDVFTAETDVVCGQSYHIKIAIADAFDEAYDSGVFLEAQSFTSMAPLTITNQVNTLGGLGTNQMMEGCGSADVTFTRTDSVNFSQTFSLSYAGSATNGTDYTNLPNTITFPAGQSSQTITVQSIYDLIPEGMENLIITITYSGACGQNLTESIALTIVDQTSLSINMLNQMIITCPDGNSLNLIASPVGGTPGYTFDWSTGESSSFITVSPASTTTYYVTVTDACGYQSVYDSVEVIIPIYSPMSLTVSNDTALMCPNTPFDLYSNVTGGAGGYTWAWSNGSTEQNLIGQSLATNLYTLTVADTCGATISDSVLIAVILPVITTQPYGATSICSGESAVIGVVASNGTGAYNYNWSTSEPTSEITVMPNATTTFTISVTDSCAAYYEVIENITVIIDKPIASFQLVGLNIVVKKPVIFINQSTGANSYYWEFGNGESSIEIDPRVTYYDDGEIIVMLVAENQAGCMDTAYQTYMVQPEMIFFVPNAFTPDGDGNNDYFFGDGIGVKDFEMRIFNRWGQLIYTSFSTRDKWDGSYKGVLVEQGMYIWKAKLFGYDGSEYKKTGHVSLLR